MANELVYDPEAIYPRRLYGWDGPAAKSMSVKRKVPKVGSLRAKRGIVLPGADVFDGWVHPYAIGGGPIIRRAPFAASDPDVPVVAPVEQPAPAKVRAKRSKVETGPAFLIGIELEGLVRETIARDFKAHMADLAYDENGVSLISFGRDDSVRNSPIPAGFSPIEIRTTTMDLALGIETFELMLCYLYLFTESGDFATNASCGLHLNLSERATFEAGDQKTFYYHVLSLFDEDTICQTFDRVKNRYCLRFFADVAACDKDIECIEQAYKEMKARERAAKANGQDRESRESKYLAVSLRDSPIHESYRGARTKAERIEFRCIGNVDYQIRFDDLDHAINHMIETAHSAYAAINV